MQYHLSIISCDRIELILDGSKTIFYWSDPKRVRPYGKVNTDDIIYIQATKKTGGKVRGKFTASKVETFDNLTPATIDNIFERYGQQMFGSRFSDSDFVNKELDRWRDSKYATGKWSLFLYANSGKFFGNTKTLDTETVSNDLTNNQQL